MAALGERLLQLLCEPRTIKELASRLPEDVEKESLKRALQELEQRGEVECKYLCENCSVYTCFPVNRQEKRFKTPKGIIRQVQASSNMDSSARARLSFKSPARVDGSSGQLHSSRHSTAPADVIHSHGTQDPEEIAREVLQIQEQLDAVEGEIEELSRNHHESELQVHINSLHEYNEMKDIGQLLLGKLAEVRGTTTTAMYETFGLDLDD